CLIEGVVVKAIEHSTLLSLIRSADERTDIREVPMILAYCTDIGRRNPGSSCQPWNKVPRPHPLSEGRGHVKLCPLRRRSRGERAPVKLGALCRRRRRARGHDSSSKSEKVARSCTRSPDTF